MSCFVVSVVLAAQVVSSEARESYWLGRAAADSQTRVVLFQRGIDAAKRLLAAKADDPEGLFWLAANRGAHALERGKLVALGVLPEMERLLLQLDKIAPRFENAGAARTLGTIYSVAPPVISIGSRAKAKLAFDRALALAPDFLGNLALAAEFYEHQGETDRAVALAKKALSVPPPVGDPEASTWLALARRILEENS